MSTPEQFLDELRREGVKLWCEDGQLRYRAAKGLLTPARIEGIRNRKVEILKALKKHAVPATLSRQPRCFPLPLSFAQERLWFLEQLEDLGSSYNMPGAIALEGQLDICALEKSFAEIERRHETLRTRFVATNGIPTQVIDLPAFKLQVLKVEAAAAEEWEKEVRKKRDEEAWRKFDVETGPLFRVVLLRLAAERHLMLITMHHIVSDGISVAILIRELTELYEAFSQGRHSPLRDLPVQYADFAIWQRTWLQGEILEGLLAYWRVRLADVSQLRLPMDRNRPALITHKGASVQIHFPVELADRLKALCRSEGATLYMALLAAFQLLLFRYTGQPDIAVGSPVAGRSRKETENLIGFFVNTVVIRTRIAQNISFPELLQNVRDHVLGALLHQDAPFEKVVEALVPERQLTHSPLFQVMFVFQNAPLPELRLGDLRVHWYPPESRTSKFELTLAMEEHAGGFTAVLEYKTDLFSSAVMSRMLAHYRNMVEQIVHDQGCLIEHLNLLSDAEKKQLLQEWNDTTAGYDWSRCVHQLFEQQAEKSPTLVALEFEGKQLSYRELNQQANQLAHYLLQAGVKPEMKIGICIERSLEAVIGMLGVLKSGCAFVPVDPDAPAERQGFMLRDAGTKMLLTQGSLVQRLSGQNVPLVCLDAKHPVFVNESPDNLHVCVDPQTLAYVIYTSGSTGVPKGVTVEHRQLLNYVLGILDREAALRSSAIVLVQPFTVDACLTSLLAPLVSGGTLHLVSHERALSSESLGNYLATKNIDVLKLTPSHFKALCADSDNHLMPSRLLVLGGESFDWDWIQLLTKDNSGCAVLNQYGPTETTIGALTFRLDESTRRKKYVNTPIGRPLPNARVYVLDDELEPLPVGVTGQLCIGGSGVARGYLNRPELSAEKFLPDPFSCEPGSRMYLTGDTARFLEDGNIEFLGRRDHQVKVRGYRIELEEIETVLQAYGPIQHAALVISEDDGEKKLIAYFVLKDVNSEFPIEELRKYAAEKLPEYMVPSRYIKLDQLPLTVGGKIDRARLHALQLDHGGANGSIAGRQVWNEHEDILCAMWQKLLGPQEISSDQNFFQAGGHSLLATRMVSQIRAVFGVELPLREVFSSPTVRGLAARIEEIRKQRNHVPEPKKSKIVPRDDSGPTLLSFAQQRLWFLDQLEPASPVYNVAAEILLQGELNTGALERAFNQVVERHEILRTVFDSRDGQPVQICRPAQQHRLHVVDLTHLSGEDGRLRAEELIHDATNQPFDLRTGPLFRTTLFRIAPREYVLLVMIHHIVSDAWSTALLTRETSELYRAEVQGGTACLPDLPIQYADFAVWQREWLQGDVLDQQLHYWQQRLSGCAPVLELPADGPRPQAQSFKGSAVPLALSPSLSQSLKVFCRSENVTLFMGLLAIFKVLLHRYTGSQEIVVGTPIANRQRPEVENLIGFFTNTLAIRSDLSASPAFRNFLSTIRETMLDAYANQDLPFEYLVEKLSPQRRLAYSPVVQVMFVVTNGQKPQLELPGVTATSLSDDFATAKFDITVYLDDSGDQIEGSIEYSTDLFSRERMQRMASHFQKLAASVVNEPEALISELELLTNAERQQLLEDWNQTRAPYQFCCIHKLFEDQVERTPESPALIWNRGAMSYKDLNQKSNKMAHFLRRLGIRPGMIVAILADRDPAMIAAVIGTSKAGGCCLLLDPRYPKKRLELILEDSGTGLLLTCNGVGKDVFAKGLRIIDLDLEQEAIERESSDNPAIVIDPESGIYAIYTSGSTGMPKGVVLPHRALVNLIQWQSERGPRSGRVLQFASLTFDVSFQEIFSTVSTGGVLVLLPESLRADIAGLGHLIEQERIERFHLPVVVLHRLAEQFSNDPRPLVSLREIVAAGEQLHITESVVRLFSRLNCCVLYNQYGPSETHVVTSGVVEGPPADWPVFPSIGKPIANTQTYVLDTHLQPVPLGVTGELYLGGDCLAQGYLHRPALTAERFLPNPFSAVPGSRMYKTGDLVRVGPAGYLEILGRNDFQVKIRGMRVELGEIEAELRHHAAVSHAAIVPLGQLSEKKLAAYVVPRAGQTITPMQLREFLKTRLPEHMVPHYFVLLAEFPLTASGKINRLALPAPAPTDGPANSFFPACTAVEKVLVAIYEEVLERTGLGIFDDFFDLGGHSLKATQVVSRIREAFSFEFPLRAIFETPTVAGLEQVLLDQTHEAPLEQIAERLLQKKYYILESQISGSREQKPFENVPSAAAEPAEGATTNRLPLGITRIAPLSFAQQRLWFLDQYEPGTGLYNLAAALRLKGPLNIVALESALSELIKRHESLRTTFEVLEERPVQVIHEPGGCELQVMDAVPAKAAEDDIARQYAIKEAAKPFDLARGPLLRTLLVHLGQGDHLFMVTMHHIISDGWSLEIFVRELTIYYDACCRGRRPSFPKLAMRYADFTVWQREFLKGRILSEQMDYWRRRLAGAPTSLELPVDRPRPAYKTFNGSTVSFHLEPTLSAAVEQLSRTHGTTVFMTLLAAFYLLLFRYTAQEDLVIGTLIANRNHRGTEEIIGFFVNTLVLRIRLCPELSFSELLAQVREICLEAYQHQDVPFEKLVEELHPERNLSHSPFFQVLLHFQNVMREEFNLTGLSLSTVETPATTAKFDLSLTMSEDATGLKGNLNYNTDLFESETASRITAHFHNLVRAIVSDSSSPIGELQILSDQELKQILHDWNGCDATARNSFLMHEIVENHALRQPARVAVEFGNASLTYAELNHRANQVAHYLHKAGVGPESVVGICMERSCEMMIALIGVLKSGAAYLALDPALPRVRIDFMLSDAQVSVVLTQNRLEQITYQEGIRRISVDQDPGLNDASTENPLRTTHPENLAYIIYTSGSTGKPKGIMIDHGSLMNYVRWTADFIFESGAEAIPAVQSLTFDGSLKQIFTPLLNGSAVWLLDNDEAADATRLINALGSRREPVFSGVPSLWRSLLDAMDAAADAPAFTAIEKVLLGGEELPRKLVERTFANFPDLRLWNLYGPSEITATATAALIGEDSKITIGRPIAGKKIYILDSHLQPVPIGVPGEIYIGGEGLARGYLGQPDLTAANFIPDPFCIGPSGRLYRTHDKGRYLANGEVEFMGRLDNQVKIRGFRIELGEIEAVLRENEDVREAVTAVRTNKDDEDYIAAYVVPAHPRVEPSGLRAFLKERLPEYMIPSAWVKLSSLPLMHNGKVDRAALPEPEKQSRESNAPFVAPQTVIELDLARIFSDVLGIADIGIYDNFFELGGHSLSAARAVIRIRQRFNVELPLRQFFESASISKLSRIFTCSPRRGIGEDAMVSG